MARAPPFLLETKMHFLLIVAQCACTQSASAGGGTNSSNAGRMVPGAATLGFTKFLGLAVWALACSLGDMQARLCAAEPAGVTPAENVLLVTIDGLRWQEVFLGAEAGLMTKEAGNVMDVEPLKQKFWRETPAERRAVLMPFLWNTVAKEGQLYGNRLAGSRARVTNGMHFSYPGYNELLSGAADDERINSNSKIANPNITVLEWLNRQAPFRGKVAAFGSWDVFPFIINTERSGVPVNAGWMPLTVGKSPQALAANNALAGEITKYFPTVRYDAFTIQGARDYLELEHPRVLYVSLGEPDDWAHAGKYDLYLETAQACDHMIASLWELAQSLPQYQGKTALVVTVDHGRGFEGEGWKNHSTKIPGSDEIWVALLGPGIAPRGELKSGEVTQSQIAATVASLLGADFTRSGPQVAPPIAYQAQ